jgi:hypothetical protein
MSQEPPQDEYNRIFHADRDKLKAAFNQVSDIRKFEIELYWKRAGYFWALIVVAFGGYFAVLNSEHISHRWFFSFIIGSIGVVFTFAWYLVNRGSKYWQENWENHLDLLEDNVTGPLYKTLLQRPSYDSLAEKYVTGPASYSVSKINQWVSVFVLFVWVLLAILSFVKSIAVTVVLPHWAEILFAIGLIAVVCVVCRMMVDKGKTHKGEHKPDMMKRKTRIGRIIDVAEEKKEQSWLKTIIWEYLFPKP